MAQREHQSKQTSEPLNLKAFNSTGNDDTTAEVLTQRLSPAAKRRNTMLITVVALAILLLGFVAYQRSGLSLIPQAESGPSFGAKADEAARDQKVE